VGLLIVIAEVAPLVELVVAAPRWAICAKTSVLPSVSDSSNTAFEIKLEKKEEVRIVPISLKISYQLKRVAKIRAFIEAKLIFIKKYALVSLRRLQLVG
jgi:hypothetical protein